MKPEEVLRVLRAVRQLSEEKRMILVGGQAVAFWINLIEASLGGQLAGSRPTVSKDIDFEGSGETAKEVARLLGGIAYLPDWDNHSPNTGLVEYTDPDGEKREIDFLGAPLGLDERDVERSAIVSRSPIPARHRTSPSGSCTPSAAWKAGW